MVNLDTLCQILVLVAPVLASIATIVTGISIIFRRLKKDKRITEAKELETLAKVNNSLESIAIIKAKLESIEKHITKGGKK